MKTRSRLLRGIGIALLGTTIAACGGNDSSSSSSASSSSSSSAASSASSSSDGKDLAGTKLTLYSGRNETLVQPLIDKFKSETGVEVEVRYGSSAEMLAAILEEGDRSPADVFFSQEVGAVGVLAKQGSLTDLPDAVVKSVGERFRPKDDNSWVGVSGRSRVIVYNPELVPNLPAGIEDLVKPEYKDMVAWVPGNAGFQASITGFRASQGDAAAEAWIKGMQANGVTDRFKNNNEVLAAVDAGEIPMGLINHYYWAKLVKEKGAENVKAKLIFPAGEDPGGLVNATAVGILKGAKDNPAALALVEYLVSKDGQTYFTEQTYEYPVIAGVDDPAGLPALSTLQGPNIDLTDLDSLAETQTMLRSLGVLT